MTNDTNTLLQISSCVTNTVLIVTMQKRCAMLQHFAPFLHSLLYRLPHLYSLVNTGRCYTLAIGRPCHAVDVASVTGVGAEGASGWHIPDLHGFIVAASGD